MICKDFSFNGKNLSDFYCSTFDPDTEQTFPARESIHGELTAVRTSPSYYGTKYSDNLTLNFLIRKDTERFSELSEMHDGSNSKYFSQQELRDIRAWLESTSLPSPLITYGDDGYIDDVQYFGFFKDVQPDLMSSYYCIGLKLVFECSSPNGYSDLETVSADVLATETTKSITINNTSDVQDKYIYPTINIYVDNTKSPKGTITIKNVSDNNNSVKLSIIDDTIIKIDCEKNMIEKSDGSIISIGDLGLDLNSVFDYNNSSAYVCNLYWPRLVYGNNEIQFLMDTQGVVTKVEVSARFVRKVDGM